MEQGDAGAPERPGSGADLPLSSPLGRGETFQPSFSYVQRGRTASPLLDRLEESLSTHAWPRTAAAHLLREWTGESCFIGEQLFMENRNHVVIQGAVAGASKMLAPWESPATSLNAELSSVGWGSGSRRCNQLPADGDAATSGIALCPGSAEDYDAERRASL